jgi:CheY-like chemotaxis protein
MPNDRVLAGLRILVVEDEPIVAWDLATALESHGCEVVGPACGLAQAEALSREPLESAVLDVNLGDQKVFPVAETLAERQIPRCEAMGGWGDRRQALFPQSAAILVSPIETATGVHQSLEWRRVRASQGEHPILPLTSSERGPSSPFQGKDYFRFSLVSFGHWIGPRCRDTRTWKPTCPGSSAWGMNFST